MNRSGSSTEGARFLREAGYNGCVELANGTARVVLEPNLGGRVVRYSLNGVEALHQERVQEGMVWDGIANLRHPSGGRFDIGPEYGGLPHNEFWLGRWTAEIIGNHGARLTSMIAPASGLQLVREFSLGAGSHLRCIQRIRNRGAAPVRTFHWSRTFLPNGGIALAPLPRAGRFPRGYAMGGPAGTIDFLPAPENNVRVREGTLEIIGPPRRAKFVLDVEPGWLAYLATDGVLFVKQFPVFPTRTYGELAANNASIWYASKDNTPQWPLSQHVVEVEAIGPLEVLAPGAECAFTEDWWLTPFGFPAEREVDLTRLRATIGEMREDQV